MQLLTKPIIKQAMEQYKKGSDFKAQMVVAKFFHPMSNWNWYLMNMDDENGSYCWGIVDGFAVESGSFSMDELRDLKVGGLPMERDRYFKPIKADELWKQLNNK